MTAPSKNWTNILDTQIDADSPLDTTLLTEIRDNLVNLKEWLGLSYTAAQNHSHDGVNSASVVVPSFLYTSLSQYPYIWDDFMYDGLDARWSQTLLGVGIVGIASAKTGGELSLRAGGSASASTAQIAANSARAFLPTTEFTIEARLRIGTNASVNPRAFYAGVEGGTNLADIICVYAAPTDWRSRTGAGGVFTDTLFNVGFDAGFHRIKIHVTSTAVDFYWDGVLKVTHTTNIPQINLGPILRLDMNGNDGACDMRVDYVVAYSTSRP